MKLVVALTLLVVVGGLLVKFQFILTPLMIAFVLAYLLHPLAAFLQRSLHLSWGISATLIYFLLVLLSLGLLTIGGVGAANQVQSIITIVQDALKAVPQLVSQISGQTWHLGPFTVDLKQLDLNSLSSQLLDMVQPLLNKTGTLVSALAGSAATFLGWAFFVVLVSYFVLAESGGLRGSYFKIDVPGYNYDIGRLGRELGRIWNAFLRGQIIIFLMAVAVYSVVLGVLGVHYALSLAFLAGLARFVPYAGPAVNWTVLVLVAYFQAHKLFGLSPLSYSLLVLVTALVIDQIFDNVVSPRILSAALKVHPAAVLVAAIIAANLFGFAGVVVAAPILATADLVWRYITRKLLDLDPWPEGEAVLPPPPPAARLLVALRRRARALKPGGAKRG